MRLLGFIAVFALWPCPKAVAAKRDARGNYLSINEFGGIADGSTDNGPAFRRAFAALAASGGGTLEIPASALPYVVATADPVKVDGFTFIARIPSDVRITGKGTIKLGDNVNSRPTPASHDFGIQMFGNAAGASDIEVDGITLDMNGAHNLQPAKSEVHPQYGFRFTAHGAYAARISVHDVIIKDCAGNNMIVFQGSEGQFASVIHCTLNTGGKGIAANVNNADFSFIYTQWRHSKINRNIIYQNSVNTGASGGIELHNGGSEAIGNNIAYCYPGILMQSTPGPIVNVTVAHNIITGGFAGISLWGGVMPFHSVRINDNRISLQYNRGQAMTFGESYGIGQPYLAARSSNMWDDTTANGVGLEDLTVARNVITMNTALPSENNISMGITLNGGHNIVIEHNTIEYMSSVGININGSMHGAEHIRIEANHLLDCGNNTTSLGHSGIRLNFAPFRPASEAGAITYYGRMIKIVKNYIRESAVGGTSHPITVLGPITDVVQQANHLISIKVR